MQQKWLTAFRLVDPMIKAVPALKVYGEKLSKGLHDLVLHGSAGLRTLADLLHCIPLGHPLLTDIPIGSWTFSTFYDPLSILMRFNPSVRHTADELTVLGVVASIPTAVAGLTDYATIKGSQDC